VHQSDAVGGKRSLRGSIPDRAARSSATRLRINGWIHFSVGARAHYFAQAQTAASSGLMGGASPEPAREKRGAHATALPVNCGGRRPP